MMFYYDFIRDHAMNPWVKSRFFEVPLILTFVLFFSELLGDLRSKSARWTAVSFLAIWTWVPYIITGVIGQFRINVTYLIESLFR